MATHLVHLVRHGESSGNVDPALFRQGDPPLTPRGREQAARVAEALRAAGLDAVFSSPLRRARETAEAIAAAAGLEVRAASGFHEVDMGRLSRPESAADRAERDALFAAWLAGDRGRGFPGGEDFPAVVRRVEAGLAALAAATAGGGRLAVVSHRIAIAAAVALGAPGGDPPGACAYCSVTTLRRDGDGPWRLEAAPHAR